MRTLFNTPETMAALRRQWNRPDTDIGDTFKVKEFLNGGLVENNNSVSAVPCYVRIVSVVGSIYLPIEDCIVEVELVNASETVAEEIKWRLDVVDMVKARLRLWGVPYMLKEGDNGNVFITYKFGAQLTGGDDVCGTCGIDTIAPY